MDTKIKNAKLFKTICELNHITPLRFITQLKTYVNKQHPMDMRLQRIAFANLRKEFSRIKMSNRVFAKGLEITRLSQSAVDTALEIMSFEQQISIMKTLSFTQVNQLRSGQTLFWIKVFVDIDEKLVVEFKEQLLIGKKTILPELNSIILYKPTAALFTRKISSSGKMESFQIPTDDCGTWFFSSRRSALRAVKDIKEGRYFQFVEAIMESERKIKHHREKFLERSLKWNEQNHGKSQQAIRAVGEAEMSYQNTLLLDIPKSSHFGVLGSFHPPVQSSEAKTQTEPKVMTVELLAYCKKQIEENKGQSFPINLYGDEATYKPFPEIGEIFRPDAILLALHNYANTDSTKEINKTEYRKVDYVFDKIYYAPLQ